MSTCYVEADRVVIAGQNLPDDFWSGQHVGVYRKTALVCAVKLTHKAVVRTPEGDITAEPGDYLVTDNPPTHAWAVNGSAFESTYDRA